MAVKPKHVEAN